MVVGALMAYVHVVEYYFHTSSIICECNNPYWQLKYGWMSHESKLLTLALLTLSLLAQGEEGVLLRQPLSCCMYTYVLFVQGRLAAATKWKFLSSLYSIMVL